MKYIYIAILSCLSFLGHSQQHETYFCGQTAARQRLFATHPHAQAACEHDTRELERFTQELAAQRGGNNQLYIIPVVFHVIHENGIENISQEQIYDALNILNRDFRKLNADTADIVDAFDDIAADTYI